MRTFKFVLATAPLLCVILGSRAQDVPKRANFDRYTKMLNNSPFAVATAVAPPSATPNFAKDLYIANAAHTTDGDLVTIQSSVDRNLKEYLTTKSPNDHGYGISTIEWSDRPGATKVTISKDGQFASLTFNQALMQQAPATNAPAPPGQGGMVSPNGVMPAPPAYVPPKPASVPGVPTPPPPHVRGVIQRNPNTQGNQKPKPNPNSGAEEQ